MPAKPLTPEQEEDAARLSDVFAQWQIARKKLGAPNSQESIAAQLGIGQSAFNQYLKGRIPLNADILARISTALGVDPAQISPAITKTERERSSHWARPATVVSSYASPVGGEFESSKTLRVGEASVEYAGKSKYRGAVAVTAVARAERDGFFEERVFAEGEGGWVRTVETADLYAVQIKGDGLAPVLKHGAVVLVDPLGRCEPGEQVVVAFKDGRKAIFDLVLDRADAFTVEPVAGGEKRTIESEQVEYMHPIVGICPPSRWTKNRP